MKKLIVLILSLLLIGTVSCGQSGQKPQAKQEKAIEETLESASETAETAAGSFNDCILRTIMLTEDGGGYYTGREPKEELERNTWEGMDIGVTVTDGTPNVDMSLARPSFCSSATYMALLEALTLWDTDQAISPEAWVNLKPYTVEDRDWPIQSDGVGCWGRANANGPGMAVLVAQLEAGTNTYLAPRDEWNSDDAYFDVWSQIQPGDFLKIFWNEYIGGDDTAYERGHMVIYLDTEIIEDENGNKDGIVYYWSSNGSGYMPDKGYSISKARLSEIYRAVATHIDKPESFDNAKSIMPDDVDPWLSSLDGNHLGTTEELQSAIE